MDFVWMKHANIEHPAKVPVSAVQHWSGHGWVETDPPPRRTASKNAPAEPVESTPVDATQTVDKPSGKSTTKTQKAPSGRKED